METELPLIYVDYRTESAAPTTWGKRITLNDHSHGAEIKALADLVGRDSDYDGSFSNNFEIPVEWKWW